MTSFTTAIMEILISKGDLDDLSRRHLEVASNLLLQAELTDFLNYEKYDQAGFNSGDSRNGNYPCTFKLEYGEVNLIIPRDRMVSFPKKQYLLINERFFGNDNYSINLIEGFNKQLKRYTKRKEPFPNEEFL